MTPDDFKFKKQCQETYQKVCNLLKKNNIDEAFSLIKDIEENTKKWEEYEKSIQLRSRLMKTMTAELYKRKQIKTAELRREK